MHNNKDDLAETDKLKMSLIFYSKYQVLALSENYCINNIINNKLLCSFLKLPIKVEHLEFIYYLHVHVYQTIWCLRFPDIS